MPQLTRLGPPTDRRTIITAVLILSLVLTTVGIRAATRGGPEAALRAAGERGTDGGGDRRAVADGEGDASISEALPEGGQQTAGERASASRPLGGTRRAPVAARSTSTRLPGVTKDEITVVYYWKGDRTRTSPYLAGTGVESNVDEAEAFRKLVAFINANANGGATLMGHPINLHGRRIKGVVVEAGEEAEDYAAAAERITKELKPFAAVAAHGSISAYLCRPLAAAGIHNLATYDLVGDLAASSQGYCLPSGMPWSQQVELTEGYLLRHQRESKGRVYGVVYAEYPGLIESAPRMVDQLKRRGLNIAALASVSASLTTAQQQTPNVVARMRAAGVNTIVMPDAGAPINFTHSAQSQGYNPDYYVWPCSGQDTLAMTRLLDPAQWARAEGLTCYDEAFGSDLTNNDSMRRTEWYKAYQSAAPGAEPPAPTPFVYAALLPLVVGLEGAGPQLDLEGFRAGLDRFRSYRYDAIDGRTTDPTNMLLGMATPQRGVLTDAIRLKYNATRRHPGSSAPGAYDFPEDRRYATRSSFSR